MSTLSKPLPIDTTTPFLSVKQVADYLQLNEKNIYALANETHLLIQLRVAVVLD